MDRILDRVSYDGGCWTFNGLRDRDGYGRIADASGRSARTHRVVYEHCVGKIEGANLDHLCRNTACCNPLHLEPVTCRENTLRGVSIAAMNHLKTACPSGHAYDERNTYTARDGRRQCRVCNAAKHRARSS